MKEMGRQTSCVLLGGDPYIWEGEADVRPGGDSHGNVVLVEMTDKSLGAWQWGRMG